MKSTLFWTKFIANALFHRILHDQEQSKDVTTLDHTYFQSKDEMINSPHLTGAPSVLNHPKVPNISLCAICGDRLLLSAVSAGQGIPKCSSCATFYS